MSGGTEAFPNLGRHCAEETCHQLDFLPFECDCCKKMFCLDHRSYKAHDCTKADLKDTSVIICPVCTATVKKVFGEKEDSTLQKHNDSRDCNPALRSVKPKCPVKGCKELLTFSNKYNCKSCRKDLCLKHRHSTAHVCVETKNALFLDALAKRNMTDCGTSAGSVSVNSKGGKSNTIEKRLGSLRLGKAY
ncbi:unnamed protein product [Calypogeia fissa]